jgi:hypothetical protein
VFSIRSYAVIPSLLRLSSRCSKTVSVWPGSGLLAAPRVFAELCDASFGQTADGSDAVI